MRARLFQPRDAAAVDDLLDQNVGRDVRLADDLLVVAELAGEAKAVLVGRSAVMVHALEVAEGAPARALAQAVIAYGLAKAHAAGCRQAVFWVAAENERMRRFVEELGARPQEGVIYTLPVE